MTLQCLGATNEISYKMPKSFNTQTCSRRIPEYTGIRTIGLVVINSFTNSTANDTTSSPRPSSLEERSEFRQTAVEQQF